MMQEHPMLIGLQLTENEAYFLNIWLRSRIEEISQEIKYRAKLSNAHIRDDLMMMIPIQMKLEKLIKARAKE